MKKVFSIILVLMLLVGMLAVPVSAAGNGSLSMTSASGGRGDTVTLSVKLNSNPGLLTMTIRVSYDTSVLELTDVSDTGVLVMGGDNLNPTYGSPYTISWMDFSATSNNTKTGTIATFTFKIKDDAPIGDSKVTLTFVDSYDSDYSENSFSASSGKVTVVCKNHSYGSWSQADNTNHQQTCSVCGGVQKAAHSWNGTVTKEPSCKETGTESFTCSVCNGTKTETLDKTTDHKYGNWVKVDANNHTHTCSVCQGTETKAHTWDSGKETKPATCKEAGVMTYTCTATGCGASYTEDIPVSDKHTFGNLVAVNDTNHKDVCSVCKKEITEAHTYDGGKVTKPATCKEAGVKTFTCSGCKHTKTTEISKTEDHKFSAWTKVDADTHNRTCSVCQKVETAAHGYKTSWSKDKTGHWHACADCGDKIDAAEHTPGKEATEKNPQICTVCKYVIKPALGHTHKWADTFNADGNGHWYACSGCEEKKDEAAHDFENACDGLCETCGYTRETSHSFGTQWVSDATGHWHACAVCGEKADFAEHAPGAEATETTAQTCTACSYEVVAALGHSFSEAWSTDDNNHWHDCACGEKDALEAHSWDAGEETDDGTVFTCTACGHTRTEPKSFNWLWIVIGAAAVLLIVVILIVAKKKKK